ncbi:MAG: stage II sporulation protein R [Tenericutes bacterium]|nr:stage II sporulation protein R [Mycoplasmatota bacterium]
MKKILILLALISIILLYTNKTEEYVIVPNESIRFRIIPNSNTLEDLYMKEEVKEGISDIITSLSKENINETRTNIVNNLPLLRNKVQNVFDENNYNQNFSINYGINYFPEKTYKGVKYQSGNYESMVVSIGNASGDNYWCVLFPPLCMMEAKESEKVEYKFFIKEIIDHFKS